MMMAGSSAEVSIVANSFGRGLDRRPERFGAGGTRLADDVDIRQIRQPVADFRELLPAAFVGHDRLGAGIGEAKLQRILAEQREQRHRHQAGAECREMGDRQFQRLRQKRRDAVAAHQAIGLQHIGEARATSPADSSNEVRVAPPSSST